jgi:hypothetical protein
MDLTCGIVLQNAAQKEMFRRWADTLVQDWTHNTNTLGFYLGKLRNFLARRSIWLTNACVAQGAWWQQPPSGTMFLCLISCA